MILQEAGDHVPHVSDHFNAHTGGNDLAILLDKDTSEPGAAVISIVEASSSKDTWGLVARVERGSLRRPSVADSPTVTFCSVHNHNRVAKKRDAATSLLQRLRAQMVQHCVNFIGCDFNMSAFSTVGHVFQTRSSWLPATLSCGALVAWTRLACARASSSCLSAHMEGSITRLLHKFDNAA